MSFQVSGGSYSVQLVNMMSAKVDSGKMSFNTKVFWVWLGLIGITKLIWMFDKGLTAGFFILASATVIALMYLVILIKKIFN